MWYIQCSDNPQGSHVLLGCSKQHLSVTWDLLVTACVGVVRQKITRTSANPFIQAAIAEARQSYTDNCSDLDKDGGDYSDLEDFIVCKPDRSYTSLFSKHYNYSAVE